MLLLVQDINAETHVESRTYALPNGKDIDMSRVVYAPESLFPKPSALDQAQEAYSTRRSWARIAT